MTAPIGLPEPPSDGETALPEGTFAGTTVFVTGGGTGLGKATAIEFARLGADIVVASRKAEHLDAGRAALSPLGTRIVTVENSGFVKLRELSLGYELPTGVTGTLFNGKASAARIEFGGRNLFTWTKYTGLDPEVSNFGNQPLGRFQDVTPYPPMKQWYFTVNTSF